MDSRWDGVKLIVVLAEGQRLARDVGCLMWGAFTPRTQVAAGRCRERPFGSREVPDAVDFLTRSIGKRQAILVIYSNEMDFGRDPIRAPSGSSSIMNVQSCIRASIEEHHRSREAMTARWASGVALVRQPRDRHAARATIGAEAPGCVETQRGRCAEPPLRPRGARPGAPPCPSGT